MAGSPGSLGMCRGTFLADRSFLVGILNLSAKELNPSNTNVPYLFSSSTVQQNGL